ncbi:hypothetical protein [Pseudomonas sp. BF-R-30]|uniref:hypothetical protein n=1 Tax=Pseudomonas sp. BF-R-30 TaxID=2832384 RepID=UPI001CBF81AA|nr:hypothetical protein [Pseudomonas sp. BF-R-30]
MADAPWDMLSAIGTVAAVVVALGISGQSAWANRKAEKDRSELSAAKVLSPLSVLERKASYLFAWFAFSEDAHAESDTKVLKFLEELEVLSSAISIEDLYPLLKLPNHAAKRSARALGLIQAFVGDAHATISHPSWIDVGLAHRTGEFKRWFGMLSEIKDHLILAVDVCESAASTGAPRPSPEEIYGEPPKG